LIFGSFEILGKSGFCQFPGFLPGKTDRETNFGISDQLKILGKFYPPHPTVFEFWARLEIPKRHAGTVYNPAKWHKQLD
jgi:hypothetical protein